MQHCVKCSCGELLVKSLDSNTKVRGIKVLVFKDEGAFGICKSCDKEVALPISLDHSMLKSMAPVAKDVRLYLREVKKNT
jgi:hypothetical protein